MNRRTTSLTAGLNAFLGQLSYGMRSVHLGRPLHNGRSPLFCVNHSIIFQIVSVLICSALLCSEPLLRLAVPLPNHIITVFLDSPHHT